MSAEEDVNRCHLQDKSDTRHVAKFDCNAKGYFNMMNNSLLQERPDETFYKLKAS